MMNRKKIIAIITGAISVLIAVAYLILVFLLDSRGEMLPAPINDLSQVNSQFLAVLSFFFRVNC